MKPFSELPPFVRKWYAHAAALHDRELGAPERCLMWWFCEHADELFEAWPSTRRLARVADIGHRNISRHISNLVQQGYLVQTYPGSRRNEPARYRLTFKGAELVRMWKEQGHRDTPGVVSQDDTPVVPQDDTRGVVRPDDTVSSPVTQGVVSQDATVSSPRTTEPLIEPAQKAGEMSGGFGTPPSGGALAAEREALFTQFRTAYPKGVNVAAARPVFNSLLDEGVPAMRLIDQARALRKLIECGGLKIEHAVLPARWLSSREWELDDYSVPAKPNKTQPAKKSSAGETAREKVVSISTTSESVRTDPENDWQTREAESNRKRRQFGPAFFERVRARLDSVKQHVPLAVKFKTAIENGIRNRPDLGWDVQSVTVKSLREEADAAVDQALRGDWGDEEGYDENYDWPLSMTWFGYEELEPAFMAAIDDYVAQASTENAL